MCQVSINAATAVGFPRQRPLLGVPEGAISKATDDVEPATVSEKMRPLLQYARKLTAKPVSVTQADADAVFAAGWPPEARFFTVAVQLHESVDRGIGPNYVKLASERLARGGYLPLLELTEQP